MIGSANSVPDGDELLCYCKAKSRADIKRYMLEHNANFETLIRDTGIGAECAACRLNLEAFVGSQYLAENTGPAKSDKKLLMLSTDQYNCGYYLNTKEFRTIVRISNPNMPNSRSPVQIAEYEVHLCIYSSEGAIVDKRKLFLGAAGDHSIELSNIPNLPDFGWFTINARPLTVGFVGNIRPQVAIEHGYRCSTYHPQLVKDASTRRTMTVAVVDGKTNMFFPMINVNRQSANVRITLEGLLEPYERESTSVICGQGAILLSLDETLPGLPDGNIFVATVESDLPLRRYFFVENRDGSLSMDHFPSTR